MVGDSLYTCIIKGLVMMHVAEPCENMVTDSFQQAIGTFDLFS